MTSSRIQKSIISIEWFISIRWIKKLRCSIEHTHMFFFSQYIIIEIYDSFYSTSICCCFFRSHSQLVYISTKCTTNIRKNIDSIDKIICHISYLKSIYYIFCLFFVFIFFLFFYWHINKKKNNAFNYHFVVFFLCILMCELWNISKVFALRVKNWLNKIRKKW